MGGLIPLPSITDEKDVPFTPERFAAEPQAAHEFLEIVEGNSMNFLVRDWKEWPEDEIRYEASFRLHLIEQDMIQAHYLREKDKLQ